MDQYSNSRRIISTNKACSARGKSVKATLVDAAWRLQQPLQEALSQHYSVAPQARMPWKELVTQLRKILPDLDREASFRVQHANFPRIAELLQHAGKGSWSLRPRLFAICWMIGRPDLMEQVAHDDLSDKSLPFTEHNLPYSLKEEEEQTKFLRAQDLVLSGLDDANALEESGGHVTYPRDADELYESLGPLGKGAFGIVDRVLSHLSWIECARKRIQRGRTFKEDQKKMKEFENELEVLQKLDHDHLVKLVGSYTDPQYIGLIMRPVMDMDLKAFLEDFSPEQENYLRSFFGCLANAVNYLHSQRVRHKDLKPANILVKGAKIRITDFGIAKEWSVEKGSISTTPKENLVRTQWYASPEVLGYLSKRRSTPSDIWSLGCVFLEMATVLLQHSILELHEFFEYGSIAFNLKAIPLWIERLAQGADASDNALLAIVSRMLHEDPDQRPTARAVFDEITAIEGHEPFCGACCDPRNLARPSQPHTSITEESPRNMRSLQAILEPSIKNTPINIIEPAGEANIDRNAGKAGGISTTRSLEYNPTLSWESSQAPGSDLVIPPSEAPPAYESLVEASQVVSSSTSKPLLSLSQSERSSDTQTAYDFLQHVQSHGDSENSLAHDVLQDLRDRTKSAASKQDQLRQDRKLRISSSLGTVYSPEFTSTSVLGSPEKSTRRFSMLPDGKRPEPAVSTPDQVQEEEDVWNFTAPAPLQPPSIDRYLFALPEATLVPSYVLASANRFSKAEIGPSLSTASYSTDRPLFVYGRFMFPSILKAQAQKSLSSVYSPLHKRRLHPNTRDWSQVDKSLKHAAEAMTPALLQCYNRWRPQGMSCAAIQSTRFQQVAPFIEATKSGDLSSGSRAEETSGFVIFGLQEEALKYIDLLLSCGRNTLLELDHLQKVEYPDDTETKKSLPHLTQLFRREIVEVEIDLKDQGKTKISAVTYVWDERSPTLNKTWDPERYIRTPSFRHWSDGGVDWVHEEGALASTLQLNYVWLGDELTDAVLRRDIDGCQDLLHDDVDPSAPCHLYGYPLQAAIVAGDLGIATLLLREGASPSKSGGKYRSALIAASVHGREDLVQLLIDYKADVNAEGGHYVSALYQAVKQSRPEIGYALLESGAWVNTKDYLELFDLATEHQDRDMEELLIAYDVKQLHKSLPLFTKPSVLQKLQGASSRDDQRIIKQSKRTIVVATLGAIAHQHRSQDGSKWTGIKGVNVLKTAIDAGLPPEIVDKIGPYLTPISKVIDYIESALSEFTPGSVASSIPKIMGAFRSKSDGGFSSDSDKELSEYEGKGKNKTAASRTSSKKSGHGKLPLRSRSIGRPVTSLHPNSSQAAFQNTTSMPLARRQPDASSSKTPNSKVCPPPPPYSKSQHLEVPHLRNHRPSSTRDGHPRSRSFGSFDERPPEVPRKRASSNSRPANTRGRLCDLCKGLGWIKETNSRSNSRRFERQCEGCTGRGYERTLPRE